jgi:fatty-acyl-CoA synthase
LLEHLANQFAKFQLPDTIVTINAIPKTSVGKFDKKVLRQQYAEGKLG